MKGKRMSYGNPVRLYLLLSILFFAMLNWNNSVNSEKSTNQPGQVIFDSQESDSLQTDKSSSLSINGNQTVLDKIDWELLRETRYMGELSNQQIIDSMAVKDVSWFEEKIIKQVVKLYRTENGIFRSYLVSKFPIMMFLVVPFFAFIMQGVYYKKGQLFITNLIHSLHLHAFVYLLLSVFFLLSVIVSNATFSAISGIASLIWIFIYVMISASRIAVTGKLNLFFRTTLLALLYLIMLFTFLVLLFLITALLF